MDSRSRTRSKSCEFLRENVGIQSLSLRQSLRDQHSLRACERALKPNNHGLRTKTSGLRRTG
jgi:hypothetical protein